MISRFVRWSPLLAALLFVACKDASGPTSVATSVAVVSNVATTAIAGSVVTPALTFSVKDQNGNTMVGVPVAVTATGGGTITGAPTTTSAGETSIGTWTLGTTVGVNILTIKAGDLAPITFTINTIAGPPAQLIVIAGSQSAPAGSTISGITVKVVDKFQNGVPNHPITIGVQDGGGLVTPSSGTTDTSGNFAGITWTLGKLAVPQNLVVTSGSFVGIVPASIATQYSLEVRYFGGEPTTEVKAAFDRSTARIRGAITGSLGPVALNNVALPSGCGISGVVLNETVQDIVIYAQIAKIDGPGKILGSAGPCLIRDVSRLTVIGVMQFDSEDLDLLASTQRLEAVILHEMSHVMGFGTLWDQKSPPLITGAGGPDPRFTGTNALSACLAAGGTTLCNGGVAVENCVGIANCGGGTQDAHWREGNATIPGFRTEMMTGFIAGPGVFMAYSNMTVQSFADLGYTVNSLAADPYTVPNPSLQALLQLGGSAVERKDWEVVRTPSAVVSRNGVITRIERQ